MACANQIGSDRIPSAALPTARGSEVAVDAAGRAGVAEFDKIEYGAVAEAGRPRTAETDGHKTPFMFG